MLLHFLFTLVVILAAISAASIALLQSTKTNLFYAKNLNAEYIKKIELITQEKILQAEKIQYLITKLDSSAESFRQMEKMQSTLMHSAENTLKNLGTDLTKQLLLAHQHETRNSQIQHDQKISKTAAEIRSDVHKLVSSVKILEKEVEESSACVKTLKQSLLSPIQSSNLTEITLNNILIKSGLTPDLDFKLQPTITKGEKTYRPDAIVFLPNSEFIIIDAKASKFFLEENTNEQSQDSSIEKQSETRENLIRSVNRHLKELAERDYASALKDQVHVSTPFHSATIMFLHTESLTEKINAIDKGFLSKAWEKNIFPVGPSGLMNILSLTKRQIRIHQQVGNYAKILEVVQRLIGSIDILASHGNKLGADLHGLINSYDKFAASFNQNFISKTKSLSSFGVYDEKKNCHPLKRYLISVTDSKENSITEPCIDKKIADSTPS